MVELKKYSNSIIKRFFSVIDLTRNANSEKDFKDIEKFIGKLIVEIEGSLVYFSEVEYGSLMTNVLMKLCGVQHIHDYNVRRKAMLDSIEIVNKIINNL